MKMISVDSRNLDKIGYDHDTAELHVEFKSGGRHTHVGVPPEEYARLMSADSHGSYYAKNIRNRYVGESTGPAPIDKPAQSLDEAMRRYTGPLS